MSHDQLKKRRVMVVDDHPLLRAGIAAMINSEPDLKICCEFESADESLIRACTTHPDVAIVDLSLAEGSGLDLVKRLAHRDDAPAILVCSMHDETLFAQRALEAGARGYLSKKEAPNNLINAIRRILSGQIYLSERMYEYLFQNSDHVTGVHDLSNRELEVLELIGNAKGTSEIARELHISIKTVESHREKIKKKLQLNSGKELTRYALQWTLDQS